jgi:ABC-type lipoprotein export system ATPase subunit
MLITHDAPIARIADRVISFADGRVKSERHSELKARIEELRW